MPHMHARTGLVRQEVEIVKICNVLTPRRTRPRRLALSRGADAIVGARDKLLISMTPRCRARPTKLPPRQAHGNAQQAPEAMLCEVAVLAEQAFYTNRRSAIKPTSGCLAQQTRLCAAVSLKSAAWLAWRLSPRCYRPWARAGRLPPGRCRPRSARCAP